MTITAPTASRAWAAKGKISRAIGIPLTRSGRQRKVGRMASGAVASLLVEAGTTAGRKRTRRRVSAPVEYESSLTPEEQREAAKSGSGCFVPFWTLLAPCAGLIAAVAMKSFLAFVIVTGGVLFIAWWRFAQSER